VIQILTSKGLFRPDNGHLQYPGSLEPDRTYRPMAGKALTDMAVFQEQFVYLDNQAILSNAWAGELYSRHNLSKARLLCPGKDFSFLISDGKTLAYQKNEEVVWKEKLVGQKILDIRYDSDADFFIILAETILYRYSPLSNKLESLYHGGPFTCFDLSDNGRHLILGSMNGYRLLDRNGRPSLWGRWNPAYVNRFDTMVGDRKICSSNIIAFLQCAYHFTGKEKYRHKAEELIDTYGYLDNLMRPFSAIGPAPDSADGWRRMLSVEWNHSDDEMYFLAYWDLYPYAFNDTLREKYCEAIKDHWQAERPEKNALWNFCYAMTGARQFDLDASIWHLKEFPLDMIQYETRNSHRKDITKVETDFRGQVTAEVLPPDERPELKHNRNLFTLDAGDRQSLLSAGDTFLLPYWMGRFLGVITAPRTASDTEESLNR